MKDRLKKRAPDKLIDKLIKKDFTINKVAIAELQATNKDVISPREMRKIVSKVAKQYKEKNKTLKKDGLKAGEAREEATNENKLLAQRVKNAINNERHNAIISLFKGKKAR